MRRPPLQPRRTAFRRAWILISSCGFAKMAAKRRIRTLGRRRHDIRTVPNLMICALPPARGRRRVGPLSHLDWQPRTSCEVTAETLEVRPLLPVNEAPRGPILALGSSCYPPSPALPVRPTPADLEAATRLRTRTCTSPSPKDPLCRLGPGRLVAALLHPPIRRASGNEQQKSLLEPTTVCHRDSMFVKYSTSSPA